MLILLLLITLTSLRPSALPTALLLVNSPKKHDLVFELYDQISVSPFARAACAPHSSSDTTLKVDFNFVFNLLHPASTLVGYSLAI